MFPASLRKQYLSKYFHIFGLIQSGIPCQANNCIFLYSTMGFANYYAYSFISYIYSFFNCNKGIR